ncbi:MAG: T9SS type A sorting domain-containing protein [Bacteroidia bacterium]
MYKLRKYGILFFLLLIKHYGAAQGFNKIYPILGEQTFATSIIKSNIDNNYIIIGQSVSNNTRYLRILKINEEGDVLYDKNYGDSLEIYYSAIGQAVAATYDNNYIVGGSYTFDTATVNISQSFLIKINEDGDTLWRKFYDGPFYDVFRAVALTKDSGFIAVGEYCMNSFNTVPKLYLVKIDSAGNEQWRKVYPSANSEAGWSVQQTFDGGYIIGGWKGNSSDQYNFVVKTDSLGEIQWTRLYNSDSNGRCYITQLSDSNYIISSIYGKFIDNEVGFQAYLRKIDTAGSQIWLKYYGDIGPERFYSRVIESNKKITAVGENIDLTSNTLFSWMLQTDLNGNQQWDRKYYFNNPSEYQYLEDLTISHNNDFLMCGYITIPTTSWVIKTDSMGCIVSGCAVGIREIEEEQSFYVYPNPASNVLNISLRNDTGEPLQIKLLDISGKEIFSENHSFTGDILLQKDIGNLNAGLYFISIQTNNSHKLQKVLIVR